uniref:C2HC/C3H-type domain-containing protein n=1 Tax=Leptobrachium leishanense TaxID=445787 RepID=A0A8C5QH84_9ANUR
MAKLKLAAYRHSEAIVEPKFPTLRPELPSPKIQSRLELLKNDLQERTLKEREQKLLTLVKHDTRAHANRKYFQNQSPGSHLSPWTVEEKKWASNWTVTKKSAGIDRAHPLEPVVHHKTPAQVAADVVTMQRSPSLNIMEVKPSPPHPKTIRSKSGPSRAEMWQELQKTESSLEAEIRKKQALLREKLRRTEEELRRIQREKGEVEPEERKARETAAKPQKKAVRSNQQVSTRPEIDQGHRSHGVQIVDGETFQHPRAPSPIQTKKQYVLGRTIQEKLSSGDIRKGFAQPRHQNQAEQVNGASPARTTTGSSDQYPEYPPAAKQDMEEGMPSDSELVPCPSCGRRFMANRLEKHSLACEKIQNARRKVFDSSKARAKGTELEQFLRKNGKTSSSDAQVNNNAWRQKHESFLRTIRQTRTVQQVIARGGKLSDVPPPTPDENPDYITCPHCTRRFAPRVAERHIPKCETIKSKPRPPPQRRR